MTSVEADSVRKAYIEGLLDSLFVSYEGMSPDPSRTLAHRGCIVGILIPERCGRCNVKREPAPPHVVVE